MLGIEIDSHSLAFRRASHRKSEIPIISQLHNPSPHEYSGYPLCGSHCARHHITANHIVIPDSAPHRHCAFARTLKPERIQKSLVKQCPSAEAREGVEVHLVEEVSAEAAEASAEVEVRPFSIQTML